MRRLPIWVMLLLVGCTAACDRTPTEAAPRPPDPAGPASTPAPGGAPSLLAVLVPRTFAWNVDQWEWRNNRPRPSLSGNRVVWLDARYSGPIVRSFDLLREDSATVGAGYESSSCQPNAAGRYSTWCDEQNRVWLRDEALGRSRSVAQPAGEPRLSREGRVVYLATAGGVSNLLLYDASSGETRNLTRYTTGSGEEAHAGAIDGDLVAWLHDRVAQWGTTSLTVLNLATGEQRELATPDANLDAPAVSGHRVVWTEQRGAVRQIRVYDLSDASTRTLPVAALYPAEVHLSGDLLVWSDLRNSAGTRFDEERDIYLYDLSTWSEVPVAVGSNDQTAPSIDGNRVVWTESANRRWELRTAAVVRVMTAAGMYASVEHMRTAGDIGDDDAAATLLGLLGAASRAHDAGDAAGERNALLAVRAHASEWSGTRMSAPAAGALIEMVNALLPSARGG